MTHTHVLTTHESATKRGPGRVSRYGQRAIKRPVYYPPVLLEKLKVEAACRGARVGDPDEWNVSRLVVDILLDYFGMPKPGEVNGHGDK